MRSNQYRDTFTKELNCLKKKRTDTERFKTKIIESILNSGMTNIVTENKNNI